MRALVTGASRGIGRETTRRLAQDGFDVAVHHRQHVQEAEGLARELTALGRSALVIPADLGDRAQVERLANEVRDRWGSLDVLVHNAGAYPRRSFEELTDDEFEACVRTNLFGAAGLTRRLLPLLRRSSAGRIIFVSSVLAYTGSRHGAHYAASKAALLGLARSLAQELAPTITVNSVAPGSIDTAILAPDTPEARREREARIPLGRIGTPREVAEAIAFLASPQASYITGATIHVNGGIRSD